MNKIPPDDLEALKAEFADIEPISESDRVELKSTIQIDKKAIAARKAAAVTDKNHDANFLTTTEPAPLDPYAELAFKRDGVQNGVFKNLRHGDYEARYVLDLHHHTVEQARKAVYEFILDAVARHERCVLILHGRGTQAAKPALLKRFVNAWLPQMEDVLAFHSAQKRDGGTGAIYVLLRKSEEASEENRELFSRRQP